MPTTVKPSFCRVCHNSCAILVEIDDGRVVDVVGDKANPLYAGYTCLKGRSQAALYEPGNRLLATQKRQPDGTYVDYPYEDAVREIADRLLEILESHGPRAIANYMATHSFFTHPATYGLSTGFMDAIGATMRFTPATIDQPGKNIAYGFHGRWMAPLQKFNDIDVLVLFGSNPLVSYQGVPIGNPSTFLREFKDRGGQLVVVDPRRSEIARRADLHLQPRPGHDTGILAAMLNVVMEEDLIDHDFVDEEVNGFESLRQAVSDMTPEAVADRVGVPAADIAAAARLFGQARRSSVSAGTGPNMSGGGSLVEYLVLCLSTVCGRWMRAGEIDVAANTWMPSQPVAQADPPQRPYDLGESMRVRGLSQNLAGLPTAAAAEEMLLEGDGQIRALISCGGNPVLTWPDQQRTVAAFEKLDLLVQVDAEMSATAQMADYVIAVKRALEMPGFTAIPELIGHLDNYGLPASHAQYTDALIEPPDGSSVVEDWEFFYDVARHMGLSINLAGKHVMMETETVVLDMNIKPDTVDLVESMTRGARVPLAEIKAHPHGAFFPDPVVIVEPKHEGWEGRLDVGNDEMLADLASYWGATAASDEGFEMRLISRRNPNVVNTASDDPWRKRPYNPAYVHSDDLVRLGLVDGDRVRITSPRGSIYAIVEHDDNMRPGVVSMSHGFGTATSDPDDVAVTGSSTAALIDNAIGFDRYSGQPKMSNIPIRIERW